MFSQTHHQQMSLGTGAYKVGGAGQCSSMRRRYPWQPCERPTPGTVTLKNSVEYLPTNTYLAHNSRGREGWDKPKHKKVRKQQAIATTLCEELEASNCKYMSQGAPARGREQEQETPSRARVRCWIRLGPTPSPLRTVFPVEPQESGILYCSAVHLKKDLFNHYLYLTRSVYDVDIPQTFKSACVINATIVGHWKACSIVCVLDFLLTSSPILFLHFSFFFCCF